MRRRTPTGLAAAGAVLADRLLGEPPTQLHPVVWFGNTMGAVERRLWRDRRAPGGLYAAIGLGVGVVAGRWLEGPFGRGIGTGLAGTLAIGGRMLDRSAGFVLEPLSRDDLVGARERLPWLVGRDPTELSEAEITRAIVESVAENTVDAVIAPAFWAAVAGAPGALGYRTVNTMDAMVGHRSERYARFGSAAARLDDVANWVPARLTAALVALVRPRRAKAVWKAIRTQAPAHPSPNSGVAEAAFAAALGVTLGGESRYGERVELRPSLGFGPPPDAASVSEARRLAWHVDLAAAALFGCAATAIDLVAARKERR